MVVERGTIKKHEARYYECDFCYYKIADVELLVNTSIDGNWMYYICAACLERALTEAKRETPEPRIYHTTGKT